MLSARQNEFMKLIVLAAESEGRRNFDVFTDFLELSFRAMVGATLIGEAWEKNEAEYMTTVARYRRAQAEALDLHCKALGVLVAALHDDEGDFLGPIFSEFGGSAHAGQFFTPIDVCRMMASITLHDDAEKIAAERVLTIGEPAVGCGAMVIALAEELKRRGVAIHRRVHFTLVDIDLKCVQAAYIQCNLLGLNATVYHGDSLRVETWGAWRTLTAMLFPSAWLPGGRQEQEPVPLAAEAAKAVVPLGQLTFDLAVEPSVGTGSSQAEPAHARNQQGGSTP